MNCDYRFTMIQCCLQSISTCIFFLLSVPRQYMYSCNTEAVRYVANNVD